MLPSEPTRNQLQSAAPMPSKQLHNLALLLLVLVLLELVPNVAF